MKDDNRDSDGSIWVNLAISAATGVAIALCLMYAAYRCIEG